MQEELSGRSGRVRAGVQGNHSWIPSHNHVHQIPGTQAWQGSTLPSQREVKDSQQGYPSHSKGLQEQPPIPRSHVRPLYQQRREAGENQHYGRATSTAENPREAGISPSPRIPEVLVLPYISTSQQRRKRLTAHNRGEAPSSAVCRGTSTHRPPSRVTLPITYFIVPFPTREERNPRTHPSRASQQSNESGAANLESWSNESGAVNLE